MRTYTFGAVPDGTKSMLTRQVGQLEKDYKNKVDEEKVKRTAASLRNSLREGAWQDSSWGWLGSEKYDTSKELLERVNRIHRLNIKRFHPERIARGAITSTGAVREDSPLAAGAAAGVKELDRQVSCLTCAIPFMDCPDKCKDSSAGKHGKKMMILAAVVVIGGVFAYSFAGGLGKGLATRF